MNNQEITNGYVINLGRWGITEGLPNKPYKTEDYLKANLNVIGINNALNYAKENNFTEVVLPKGNYAICYPKSITMKSNIIFNMNDSLFKVIYDSTSKSPFDTRTTTDYYNFIGNAI
ncbi:MAG: right-handed parallel beta-helix repeat-containing protein, partial [Campylobacterales bacterium]|nr:right-handed parallel beta-helix repeat-containing protein [Campylobacterales bacterium]